MRHAVYRQVGSVCYVREESGREGMSDSRDSFQSCRLEQALSSLLRQDRLTVPLSWRSNLCVSMCESMLVISPRGPVKEQC